MTATWNDPAATWNDPVAQWGAIDTAPVVPGFTTDGPISTAFRFDVFDHDENFLGTIPSVTGGDASWDAYDAVKGKGSFTMLDLTPAHLDWLNVRVRPVIIRSLEGTAYEPVERPVGVFLCAAPVEHWTTFGREWKVELADKLSILDQDVVTSPTNAATSYAVPAGTNIVDTVVQIINEAGEPTPAISPDTKVTAFPITWEPGATRLRIINDLLDAGNYFSLWCDPWGQYRVEPYVYPTNRPPLFEQETPFSKGDLSLMAPDWALDNDIYSIPNRYIVIGQGTEDTPALTSTAVNVDPNSPYSYVNRGRWITRVETGAEATDQAGMDAYGRRQLAAATSVTVSITVDHLYLPDLLVNSVVRFTNPDAGRDSLCAVIKTTIPFSSTALCKSELRDVGAYIETEAP